MNISEYMERELGAGDSAQPLSTEEIEEMLSPDVIEYPSLKHVMSLDWRNDASCRNLPKWVFFEYTSNKAPFYGRKEATAFACGVCQRCPVREQCYEFAVRNVEPYGIWAGTTPDVRKKLYKEFKATGTLRSLQDVVPQS